MYTRRANTTGFHRWNIHRADVDLKTDYPLVESIELSVRAGRTTKDYRRYSRRLLFSPFREIYPVRVERGCGIKLPQWTIFVFEYIIAPCLGNIPAPLIIPHLNSLREMITRTPWKIEGVRSRVSHPSWEFPLFSLFFPPTFRFRFDSVPIFARRAFSSPRVLIRRRVFKRKTSYLHRNA